MLAGLALAGGAATRMGGGDKPLLPVAGHPMLWHVLNRLRTESQAVAISANGDPARFASFGVPVLPDGDFRGRGPLAGVLAGLEWAAALGAEALLTIPGDTPLAPAGLAQALAPPPACAASGGRSHHLVALWPASSAPALHQFLAGPGPFSVHTFSAAIGARIVEFTDLQFDPFLNVNTPADLAKVDRLSSRISL